MGGYDLMTNRAEIQAGMTDYIRLVGNKPEVYTPEMCSEDLMEYLHSQDVVIKGNSLGGSHPHLANYYSVEPLVDEGYFNNERFERG